ncbi:MAG: 2-amino-4-hydroxy-6-hydroxymethyldihydropteridine diphosphokinase [Nitrospirota bacterium]|nr:2-amino-4-hydroxy-6-hydroxymethyldihydropteridine diphosphokinase [Nitrospirota bacterium]
MTTIYMGIGSNLGDREGACLKALEELEKRGIKVTKKSSQYETEPWGVKNQPKFINMAAEADTDLTPGEVLRVIQEIEKNLGRKETLRWGPRTVDIDILLYDALIVDEPDLRIPHPHMHERDFVLKPLSEIAPEAIHPLLKKTVREMLSEV